MTQPRTLPHGVTIRNEMRPGDLGAIVKLHGELYAAEHGFDASFEPYVAEPLSAFSRDPGQAGRIWLVDHHGELKGSVALVPTGHGDAQLRWLILHPAVRGMGLAKLMVDELVEHARASGLKSIFLWTIDHLDAALGLYRRAGFVLTERQSHHVWGREQTEERYQLDLPPEG